MPKLLIGDTYYPGDILYSHPLWYDGVHTAENYDLIDPISLYHCHDSLYNEELKNGRLITWNPYSFCGHPIFADGKSGMLYPPRLFLHLFFSTTWAHDLLILTHLFASGCMMHLFLKGLCLSPHAAVTGATLWMLNGQQATWMESEYVAIMGVWIPLAFHLFRKGLSGKSPQIRPLVGASLALGMPGFCGVVQFWSHALLLTGFWMLYLCYRARSWKHLLAGGIAIVAPLPLAAIQLVPMFELVSRSQRITRDLWYQISAFQDFLMGIPALLITPDAFGNPTRGLALRFIADRGDWVMLESSIFLGLASLMLLALAPKARRRKHFHFFAISLVVLLVVPSTPLYWIPFKLLPGFSQTISTRLVYMMVFLLSILAAYGAQAFIALSDETRRKTFRGSWICLACWALLLLSVHQLQKSHPDWWLGRLKTLLDAGDVRYPFLVSYPDQQAYLQAVVAKFMHYYGASNTVWLWVGLSLVAISVWLAPWGKRSNPTVLLGLVALASLDMLAFSWNFNTTTSREFLAAAPPAVSYITSQPGQFRTVGPGTIRPNTTNPHHLRTIEGHNSIIPKENVAFANALQNGDPKATDSPFTTHTFPIKNLDSPLLKYAGAKYIVALPGLDLLSKGYELKFNQPNGLAVWENPSALPLVKVYPKVVSARSFSQALEMLHNPLGDDTVILETEDARSAETGGGNVVIQDAHPGSWHITAQGPGWLVLGEAFDPGWQATVNGTEAKPVRAQALFQAVKLEAGKNEVAFTYSPRGMMLGASISLGAFLFLLVAYGLGGVRREQL